MHRLLVQATLCATALLLPPATAAAVPLPVDASEVKIKSFDDVELAGTFHEPRKGRAPAVLLVHDAGADREQLESIATSLHKRGFGVLTIDLRGHGDSKTSKIDWEKLDESGRASLWQLAPRDVEAAAEWLMGQKSIHSTNLSMVGYRAGCALAARHAEQDENVISMALLSPSKKEFGFDVEQTIQNVNGLPTLVLAQRTPEVEQMVVEANQMTSTPWITWESVSSKKKTVLDDRKTASKVSAWLADVALPKKGR